VTFTDHIIGIITTMPAERELVAARRHLEALREALRGDDWPLVNAHPGGSPTAMNRAWRIAMQTQPAAQGRRWHAVAVTAVALQDVSPHAVAEEAVSAVAAGCAVADEIAAVFASSAAADRWSHRSIAGLLGAGAAAGRLLELDDARLRNVVGLCATQAAGLRDVDESESGIVQLAKVAADAVEAATLARHGFTSSADSLSGRRGLLALLVPDVATARAEAAERSEALPAAGTLGVR
jgi:MmgE/PrpD N-terminal domain